MLQLIESPNDPYRPFDGMNNDSRLFAGLRKKNITVTIHKMLLLSSLFPSLK